MSTSLLYHAFGIRGYEYVRTEYRGGEVIFTIDKDARPSGVQRAGRETFGLVGELSGSSGRCPSAAGHKPCLPDPTSRLPGLWGGPPGED